MNRRWKWSFWRGAYVNNVDRRFIKIKWIGARKFYFVYFTDDGRAFVEAENTYDGTIVWPGRTQDWLTHSGTTRMTEQERDAIVADLREAARVTVNNTDP